MENTRASSPINPHFLQPLLPGFNTHLDIPMTFFSRHLEGTTKEGNAVVKLRSDASSMTWEVKMEGRRLTQGWEKFTTTHDLRLGDMLIFKHVGNLLFDVTCFGPSCCEIQYDVDDDDDDVIQISSDSDSKVNQKTAQAESSLDNSCFVARVTSPNLRRDLLRLPRAFTRSNGLLNRQYEIVLLNEDGKPWRLFLLHHKSGDWAYIRSGWRSFCPANRKRVDDLLTFKLVQTGTTPVLQLCSSVNNQECLRAASSSSSSTRQCRFLTLTLTPSSLKSCNLYLPGTFVKANDMENATKITLVDRHGVKTTTSLKPGDRRGRMRLGKGWREFCIANGVKIGESFKLELIKEKKDTATHLLTFCSKIS